MKRSPPRLPPDTSGTLDAQVTKWLTAGQSPAPVDPALAANVKQQLLDRIADSQGAQVAVPSDGGTWRPFGPGVQIKVLHDFGGTMSYLLRMLPGSVLPNHRHPQDEECVVMEGSVRMGELTMGPGGYLLERKDTLHPPLRTVDGATLYLRGASPHKEHLV
jgi:anti-sigma factor ChrR (cupin superfamily)